MYFLDLKPALMHFARDAIAQGVVVVTMPGERAHGMAEGGVIVVSYARREKAKKERTVICCTNANDTSLLDFRPGSWSCPVGAVQLELSSVGLECRRNQGAIAGVSEAACDTCF